MKLIRYRENDSVKPGIIHNNQYLSVAQFVDDYNEQFFENDGLAMLQTLVEKRIQELPEVSGDVSLDSPVARPSKLVCVGLNYAEHAEETKMKLPDEPVIFVKNTTAITGPNDPVVIPRGSQKTDWEVELALVIGKRASYVEEKDAMDYVAAYLLHNDVSERAFQLEREGQWIKGKGCDTFAPLGPWLVTKDEVSDPNNVHLWLKVNGETMQDSNTKHFIFKIPYLISYISQFMTLLPGDIVSTGTPDGVGLGRNPQVYLKSGDVMELGIDGLGQATQHVISYEEFIKS